MKTNRIGFRHLISFCFGFAVLFHSVEAKAAIVVLDGPFISAHFSRSSPIGGKPSFITGLNTNFTFTSTSLIGLNPLVVTVSATDTKTTNGGPASLDVGVTTGLVRRNGRGIGVGDGVGGEPGTQQNGYDELQSDESLNFTFNHDLTITQANVALFETVEDRQLWQVGASPVYTIKGGGVDGGDFDFAIDDVPDGRTEGVPATGIFIAAGETLTIRGGNSDPLFSMASGLQIPSTADGLIIGFTMHVAEIPEPSSALLLASGGFFMVLRRRRHQTSKTKP